MTKTEKGKLKEEIIHQLEELKKTIQDLEDEIKPIPHNIAIGRLTRMEAIGSKEMNEAALRAAKEKKEQLKDVLKEIDKPGFGKCAICGDTIPIQRLMIVPESNKCVNCAN